MANLPRLLTWINALGLICYTYGHSLVMRFGMRGGRVLGGKIMKANQDSPTMGG